MRVTTACWRRLARLGEDLDVVRAHEPAADARDRPDERP